MDWGMSASKDTIFYIMNSQECPIVKYNETNSYTALNVIWGLLFLVLGVCTVLLNVTAIRGLYSTTSRTGDLFKPVIYVNISILDVVMGLCTLLSGGIMLSNFTWDESDGGGKFLCNLFGIMFTLVVQTKVMLMSGGLFISVIALVSGSKIEHTTAVRISAVVVVLSWVVGIIHAFLPYMFGSVYVQPDYLTICIGSFAGMSNSKTDNYYSGQLIMLFIPLVLGCVICCFTIPGMISAKRSTQVYKWDDELWGVFTMTMLFMSYLICHATYFIVHLSGMSEMDERRTIDFCKLSLLNMRYFFAFMVFTMYLSGIAEPLSYLTTNMALREKVCARFPDIGDSEDTVSPASTGNRVTPLLIEIRHREEDVATPKREIQQVPAQPEGTEI